MHVVKQSEICLLYGPEWPNIYIKTLVVLYSLDKTNRSWSISIYQEYGLTAYAINPDILHQFSNTITYNLFRTFSLRHIGWLQLYIRGRDNGSAKEIIRD